MNINTGVIALNVSNVLVKRQLDKDQENKTTTVALKINEEIQDKVADLSTTNENLVAAESNIDNIDMAESLLKRTKDSILERSAMALLSQAKKNSTDVMNLLK
jgi:hypothetical protein